MAPIDMILFCPACGKQHIDEADAMWGNPAHKSHLCKYCNHIWRPAEVETNGVFAIETGKTDTLPPIRCSARSKQPWKDPETVGKRKPWHG